MSSPLAIPELLCMVLEYLLPDPYAPSSHDIDALVGLTRVARTWNAAIRSGRIAEALFLKPCTSEDGVAYIWPDLLLQDSGSDHSFKSFKGNDIQSDAFVPGHVVHPLIAPFWDWTIDYAGDIFNDESIRGVIDIDYDECDALLQLSPLQEQMQLSRPPVLWLDEETIDDGREKYDSILPEYLENPTGITLGNVKNLLVHLRTNTRHLMWGEGTTYCVLTSPFHPYITMEDTDDSDQDEDASRDDIDSQEEDASSNGEGDSTDANH